MKKSIVSRIVLVFIVFFGIVIFLLDAASVRSEAANHIVISEIQIAGTTTTDEFVELYNPTLSPLSVANWKLFRKTAAIDAEEQLIASLSGEIQPRSFLLITHENYDGVVGEDITYSTQNIADNNTVILKNSTDEIIDIVGMGVVALSETSAITAPVTNRSIERKALLESTAADMRAAHALFGNGEDSDNNAADFVRHLSPNVSDPQNSTSPAEFIPTPTLSPSLTPTPTNIPTPTLTPTPTSTLTPTPTNIPTPTLTPTVTPTNTPTPIITVSPTLTLSPTSTPSGDTNQAFHLQPVCTIKNITLNFGFFVIRVPFLSCTLVKV